MSQIKFKKLKHIFNCDLLNKYIIKSVFQLPQLNSILIKLSIKDLAAINNNLVVPIKAKDYKIKAFLSLFFYFLNIPYYKIQKVQQLKPERNEEAFLQQFFQIFCSNKFLMHELIFSLFIENKLLINNQGKNIFNKFLITAAKKTNSCSVHLLVAARMFENFDKLSTFMFNATSFKQINFQLLGVLSKPNKVFNIQNLIHNMPFFWING